MKHGIIIIGLAIWLSACSGFTIDVYDGADHAFANPSGRNYQAEPANDAWEKTLAFFDTHLKS